MHSSAGNVQSYPINTGLFFLCCALLFFHSPDATATLDSMACSCRGDCYFSNSSLSFSSLSPPTNRRNGTGFLHSHSSTIMGTGCRGRLAVTFPSLTFHKTITRRKSEVIQVPKAEVSESNTRKANLFARRKENIKLPNYDDGCGRMYPINEFLSHPSGVEAILNTRAMQSFQSLDSNTYRCTLPKIRFLNFEVAPVLDLRVTATSEDCTVEMLSCKHYGHNLGMVLDLSKVVHIVVVKLEPDLTILPEALGEFEGSETVVRQNDHFSAFMMNHIKWDANGSDPSLDVDVKLNLTLEIYTPPFTLLPKSAVENPGNLIMQALVDKLVPLLLEQLLQDYENWVHEQRRSSP